MRRTSVLIAERGGVSRRGSSDKIPRLRCGDAELHKLFSKRQPDGMEYVNDLPSKAGRVSWKGELTPHTKEEYVKNPLDSLWGTVISGLVLTLILYWIVKLALGS